VKNFYIEFHENRKMNIKGRRRNWFKLLSIDENMLIFTKLALPLHDFIKNSCTESQENLPKDLVADNKPQTDGWTDQRTDGHTGDGRK
jgi:hypothetical protein